MKEALTIEDVLNRMYNWKVATAFEFAQRVPNFPPNALQKLEKLAEQYDNCGWSDGTAFAPLRNGLNQVASILGYEWDDEQDYWIQATS